MKQILPIFSIILLAAIHTPVYATINPLPTIIAEPIVRLYPNPATTFITVDFQRSFDKGYSLQVYSFLGKKMYDAININQKTTVNLADYNRGIYIYYLLDRSGKVVETGKFQVSK